MKELVDPTKFIELGAQSGVLGFVMYMQTMYTSTEFRLCSLVNLFISKMLMPVNSLKQSA